MMTTDDIAQNLQPDAVGTSPTAASATAARPRRPRQGHRPKIRAAFDALERDGLLHPHLRPCARFRVVIDWLMAAGYAKDLPKRDAVEREYKRWLREHDAGRGGPIAQPSTVPTITRHSASESHSATGARAGV
ncbi:MAG TPA: hypothetical protein VGF29_01880 [Hyphomicrobiaceae bacterium]|jgi:hypothetical protein